MLGIQHAELGWNMVFGRPGTAPSQGSWRRLPCLDGLCITQPRAATGLQGQGQEQEHDPAAKRQVWLLGESLVLHLKQQQDSNPT